MRAYVESKSDPTSTDEATHGKRSVELPSSLYEYDLFAVVTHEGKLDNGHYWADVLSEDEWWHCDDDKSEHSSSLNLCLRLDSSL